MVSIGIVIPIFNHGVAALKTVEKLLIYDLPIFLVNDGSDDVSSKILGEIATKHAIVTLVERSHNGGKGAAVKSGLDAVHKHGLTHALQIDGDGQHDTGDVGRFVEAAMKCPDAIIVGCPVYDDTIPKGRLIARYLTHFWIWIETLSFEIRDSMCGFRVYPLASTIELLKQSKTGNRMDFDPEILVRHYWRGTRFVTLETKVIYPPGGTSNFKLFHDNWLISAMHTRLFFGMLLRLPSLIVRKFK